MTARPPRRPWPAVAVLAALACEPAWRGFGAHACALLADGAVACWGSSSHGQLGDGAFSDRPVAGAVAGLPAARAVSAGNGFTCAVTAAGEVWCWGRNDRAQLGAGAGADRPVPARVPGLAGVANVTAGKDAACAVGSGGEVSCWGRLGGTERGAPAAVTGLPLPALAAAAGSRGVCALLSDGRVFCAFEDLRALDAGLSGATALGLYGGTPCAILAGGAVSCAAALAQPATDLGGGPSQACAVVQGGDVYCWGTYAFGAIERFHGTSPFGPSRFATGAVSVAVGEGFACARLAAGGVACWGDNWSGQLGDGTTAASGGPVPVAGLPGPAAAVSASRGRMVWDYGCGTVARPGEDDD